MLVTSQFPSSAGTPVWFACPWDEIAPLDHRFHETYSIVEGFI